MHLAYLPARLVKGLSRWYILYYQVNPDTGRRERFRETYDLNRIVDLDERLLRAEKVIEQVNSRLPLGFPFEADQKKQMNIVKAIELAYQIKTSSIRKRTKQTLTSIVNVFNDFLAYAKLSELDVSEFRKKHAIAFFDYATIERKIGNRTYNNYLERIRTLFAVLEEREYIHENPFAGFKKKRVSGKNRRAFNEQEKTIVASYIQKSDAWLFLGVILQYYCFIRPIELRRLRFYMIDLDEGIIRLTANETKNKENAIITIPDVILPYLRDFGFGKWRAQYLIFGRGLQPHADKACGHDALNSRHKAILEKLYKAKQLTDIQGLSFYSWKDTGTLELFKKKVNPLEIMKQLRHKDLTTTQRYCQSLYAINYEIKSLDNQLTALV